MTLLLNALQDFCREQGLERTYWVAYSGGLDSHVLLHLLASLRASLPLKLRAVHVNHGLSPYAHEWGMHCQRVCDSLQVECVQQSVNATAAAGESPEAVARAQRYAVLASLLAPGDVLLTAHHQDDQAETVLLQLFRGAGPKGLSAMPSLKPLGSGFLGRPFLNFTRAELTAYAILHQLTWIDDESNRNTSFARNFIRHQITPMLKERWPAIATTLSRVSVHCAEAQQLLDEIAMQDLAAVQGPRTNTLSVQRLLMLSAIRQRQVLRWWLRQLGFAVPGVMRMQQIQRTVLQARADKMPYMAWLGVALRRYGDDLYAMRPWCVHDREQQLLWNLQAPLKLSGVGVLRAVLSDGQGLRADISTVTVQFRRGGEVCRLPGRDCHHDLKDLFQAKRIPPWERDRIPLIYVGNQLAAVPGLFVSAGFVAEVGQQGFTLLFDKIE